ncbi:MAG: type II toxin-antitoxin system VapC family toxin [Acidobacteria bacterium]|nr:type II toxin-antitoxin system VapC family toxin [Acidobacteriota bacterium]
MVLLDSNIFIIDRFFPNDAVYPRNRAFVERLSDVEAGVSVFTLLEICGAASFNLSARELSYWLYQFPAVYPVLVLDPFEMQARSAAEWMEECLGEVAEKISQKMSFGDAVIVQQAEQYQVEALITWNTKDFLRRTTVPVWTPDGYLQKQGV